MTSTESHQQVRYRIHLSFLVIISMYVIGHIASGVHWYSVVTLLIVYYGTIKGVAKLHKEIEDLERIALQCAWCKKINVVGEYTDKISHGICPDCLEKATREDSCIHITSHGL